MAVFPSDSIRTKNWGTEILTDSDLEAQLDLLHAYLVAALHSSTGHTHDGTSNQGPKLAYSGVATTFGSGFTTVTAASGDYVLIASDVSDSNTTKKALVSDIITASTFVPSVTNALSGSVIQTVRTTDSAYNEVTTVIPSDDTIPQQSTEGESVMTRSITPNNASNILIIDITVVVGQSTGPTEYAVCALFQDSTENALAAWPMYTAGAVATTYSFRHSMAAGTTSATTFKVFIGPDAAYSLYFNGFGGARCLGGVAGSSIIIREIKA